MDLKDENAAVRAELDEIVSLGVKYVYLVRAFIESKPKIIGNLTQSDLIRTCEVAQISATLDNLLAIALEPVKDDIYTHVRAPIPHWY